MQLKKIIMKAEVQDVINKMNQIRGHRPTKDRLRNAETAESSTCWRRSDLKSVPHVYTDI